MPSLQSAAHRTGQIVHHGMVDVALGNRSGEAVLLDFSVSVLLVRSRKCSSTVRGVDVKRREGIQWEHRGHRVRLAGGGI